MSFEPRSFLVNGLLYQILCVVTEGVRLVSGRDKVRLEPITVVECQILDEDLNIVATGRALKSEDDVFSDATGTMLSVSRALDYAETNVEDWTPAESFDILEGLMKAFPVFDALNDAPADFWHRWMQAGSHLDEAKLMVNYINQPKALQGEAPIFWSHISSRTYWAWIDGRAYYMTREDGWQLHEAEFTPDGMDAIYKRVADPRIADTSTNAQNPARDAEVVESNDLQEPTLLLNDTFRRDAERMGIRLDYPTGALTMADLSRLYHAMKRTQLVEAQAEGDAGFLPFIDKDMQALDLSLRQGLESAVINHFDGKPGQADVALIARTLTQLAEDVTNFSGVHRYEPVTRSAGQILAAALAQ